MSDDARDAVVERLCISLADDWRTWHGHTFAERFDRVGEPARWDALGLLRMVLEPVVGDSKNSLPLWSPTVYGPRYRERGRWVCRRSSNTVAVSMVVLDIDDGTPLDDVLAPGVFAIAHTSWSHTDALPKWRVIYPLAEPVPAQDWAQTWRGVAARWPSVDPSTKDPARMYYVPAVRQPSPLCQGPKRLTYRRGTYQARVQLGRWLVPPEAPAEDTRQAERVARVQAWAREPYQPDKLRGELAAQLRVDPNARARVAGLVGAELVDRGRERIARRAPCPSCGRPSVWWPLAPTGAGWAKCNHRNSCGWAGPLDQLAKGAA